MVRVSKKIEKECPVCNDKFLISPSRSPSHHTCGKDECKLKYRHHRRVKKICYICNDEYFVTPHRINKPTCDKSECESKHRITIMSGKNHPQWKPKIVKVCEICLCEYESYPFEADKRHTCRKPECSSKWLSIKNRREDNPLRKPKITKICDFCSCEYEVYPYQVDLVKTCGKPECKFKRRSKRQSGKNHPKYQGEDVKNICKICGEEYFVRPFKSEKRKTCGKPKCRSQWSSIIQSRENHSQWKGGIAFLPYCYKFNPKRKQATRDYFNNLCICCGKHVTSNILLKKGQLELSVHHVDHDKEQGCNGKPFNLVPLCNECHAKEVHNEEEYKLYINKTLREGFKWGIWNEEEYKIKVMYDE